MTDTPPAEGGGNQGQPMVLLTGDAGERYAEGWVRYRASGYDRRLWPKAYPTDEDERLYAMFDRGEWPPAA